MSARTGEGVSEAVAAIRTERRGRDVFVMGAANVGKSAFIRALVKDMSSLTSRQYDPQAPSRVKYLPVESAMPGTTLQLIPMEVFAAGGMLYDTPGLHLHHRVPHLLTPDENKVLHPRRRLRPYVTPPLRELMPAAAGTGAALAANPSPLPTEELVGSEGSSTSSSSLNSPSRAASHGGGRGAVSATQEAAPLVSYRWGGLARIDIIQAPPSLQLVFCGPPALRVSTSLQQGAAGAAGTPAAAEARQSPDPTSSSSGGVGSSSAEAHQASDPQEQQEAVEQPQGLFGAQSVALRGGLRLAKRLSLTTARGSSELRPQALADIAISGVPGWVSVQAGGRGGQRIDLDVWVPVGIEVFSRPPLPMTPPPL